MVKLVPLYRRSREQELMAMYHAGVRNTLEMIKNDKGGKV